MKKIVIIALAISVSLAVADESSTLSNKVSGVTEHVVGGWYPVFFDKYSEIKIDQIISTINEGRVKRITVDYDRNKTLAVKIMKKIQSKTKFSVELHASHPKDSDTIKYKHEQVVVTVWSK